MKNPRYDPSLATTTEINSQPLLPNLFHSGSLLDCMYFHFCIFSTEFRCFKTVSNRSNRSNGGRAEPMKKAKRNVFFMAQVHYGIDTICSNGDVPSNQRRRLDLDSLMRKSTMELMKSVRMVDVPSNQRRWLDLASLMRKFHSRGVMYH